jgi:hypothetical protein
MKIVALAIVLLTFANTSHAQRNKRASLPHYRIGAQKASITAHSIWNNHNGKWEEASYCDASANCQGYTVFPLDRFDSIVLRAVSFGDTAKEAVIVYSTYTEQQCMMYILNAPPKIDGSLASMNTIKASSKNGDAAGLVILKAEVIGKAKIHSPTEDSLQSALNAKKMFEFYQHGQLQIALQPVISADGRKEVHFLLEEGTPADGLCPKMFNSGYFATALEPMEQFVAAFPITASR